MARGKIYAHCINDKELSPPSSLPETMAFGSPRAVRRMESEIIAVARARDWANILYISIYI